MYISRIAPDGREQLTIQHLKETAEYAQIIGDKFSVPNMCQVAALLHDIGKFSTEFVMYLRQNHLDKRLGHKPTGRGSVIHTTQGAKFIYEKETVCEDFLDALVREIIAMCIANHHGSLMDAISPFGDTPFSDRMKIHKDAFNYSEVLQAVSDDNITGYVTETLKYCRNELEKFINKCRSNNLNIAFMIHLLTKSIFSCLVDADRYNAYCFEINTIQDKCRKLPPWDDYANRLEQKISTFKADSEIDRIRHNISENCLKSASLPKGIYRLDVPTGGGKTLSSLRFALNHAKVHEAEHIIYVLPYLSVLEQTADEIKKALQFKPGDNFILEHHSNYIVSGDSEEAQIHKLLTSRWDGAIIITTMVQFLESIYSCRSSDLRKLHNMANSVLIFDEVQSIPMKCINLFNEAINYLHYCGGSSILLCTATQPPLNKAEKPIRQSVINSLVPDMSESFKRLRRTFIEDKTIPGGYSTDVLQMFVLDAFRREGNCLVILNTKKDAASLYRAFKDYLKSNPQENIDLYHLSTLMCPAHRLDTINTIKERQQKNVICISTQLIEAGVNISFGCVIRAIAGLDSIAQAAGRCNRHCEDPNGKKVYIVNISDENLSKLPDIKCGADVTYRILGEKPEDLLSPVVISRYYDEYFHKQKRYMSYSVNDIGNLYDLLSDNMKGVNAYFNAGGKTPPSLHQAFQTAGDLFSVIEQRTTSVLVPYGEGKQLAEKYRKADLNEKSRLLHEIGLYSVSLYRYQIDKLHEMNAIYSIDDEILVLDSGYYDDKLGFIFDTQNEFLNY